MVPSSTENTGKDQIEGLAALISSLDLKSTSPGSSDAKPLDGRAAQALATKLNEILGEKPEGPSIIRNEKGQILNEQGLPVIEIAEEVTVPPTPPLEHYRNTIATPHVKLSSLSEAERAARRRQVDRILDLLEAEEEELERQAELEARPAMAERREREKERAVENMARALALSNAAVTAPSRQQSNTVQPAPDVPPTDRAAQAKPVKKVSFDDPGDGAQDSSPDVEDAVGDVTLGRLRRPASRPVEAPSNPVKFHIVERASSTPSGKRCPPTTVTEDSDDEPDADGLAAIGAVGVGSEDKLDESPVDRDGQDEEQKSSEDDDEDDLDEEFEDGIDVDSAMLRREVAFEYYRKREALSGAVGSDGVFAGVGRLAVPVDPDLAQELVPADATLAGPAKKPSSVSRFKSARLARSYLRPDLFPGRAVQSDDAEQSTASDKDFAGIIRQGKLDGTGQLIVPEEMEHDGDDLGPKGQEILQALRRGESWEIPGEGSSQRPPSSSGTINVPPVIQSTAMVADASSAREPPSSSNGKASRFKAARQAESASTSAHPAMSPSASQSTSSRPTPSSSMGLSSQIFERPTATKPNYGPAGSAAADSERTSHAIASSSSTDSPRRVSRFKARRGES